MRRLQILLLSLFCYKPLVFDNLVFQNVFLSQLLFNHVSVEYITIGITSNADIITTNSTQFLRIVIKFRRIIIPSFALTITFLDYKTVFLLL